MSRVRRALPNPLRLLVVLALVAGGLTWAALGSSTPEAQAADPWSFQAGNIISDGVFYDANTANAGDIQVWLQQQNPNCRAGSDGTPCLKDFRQDTWTRAADGLCGSYSGAAQESAATIIYKVAQACGINPRVFLVMLQKEQALVTDSGSSLYSTRYRSAMGYGCPDTSVCDSQYYGFYNQLYSAAHQFKRYQAYPNNYGYRPGAWNTILYSPKGAALCGSSSVYIQNQATAGLYNYTPYQPNNAALNAGYGTGDGCSAYGNRNFYLYFTDWFGTTGAYTTSGPIAAAWQAQGGGTGWLGWPATEMACGLQEGGCAQHFQGGSIYWTPALGAHVVSGAIRGTWAASGWQAGPLGYPNYEMTCQLPQDGCGQSFERGQILWTQATGAWAMTAGTMRAWEATGRFTGTLGYPTAGEVCGLVRDGCRQQFQTGSVYGSPATGSHVISGNIGSYWLATYGETGPLGYPTTNMTCTTGGCSQSFEGGQVSWTSNDGIRVGGGGIGSRWAAQGYGSGPLGYAVGDQVCGLVDAGCSQDFQNGTMYWSTFVGAWAVSADIGTYWKQHGGDASGVGYPVGDMTCTANGCSQPFQRGLIGWTSAHGAHYIAGTIENLWEARGAGSSSLGYPVSDMVCGLTAGGCTADFENGSIYSSPSAGTWPVSGGLATYWKQHGGDASVAGYPIGDMTCTANGCTQPFQTVRIAGTTQTGYFVLSGAVNATWLGQGGGNSQFGYPVAEMNCDATGCSQQFQNGYLGWTPSHGIHFVNQPFLDGYQAAGADSGPLHFPVADGVWGLTGGGSRLQFQGGWIYWSPATGAHAVSGAIASAWVGMGAERSALGYPVGDMTCDAGGCVQQFQNGYLAWSPTDGVHVVKGAFATAWSAAGGAAGSLGYPTQDASAVSGGQVQVFQGGRLTYDSATGTVTRS